LSGWAVIRESPKSLTVATSVNDTYVRFDIEAVLKIGDPEAVRRAAMVAVDVWTFPTEDVEQAMHAAADAGAAVRESHVEARDVLADPVRLISVAGRAHLVSNVIDIQVCDRKGLCDGDPP
jgi:hypothetical protein